MSRIVIPNAPRRGGKVLIPGANVPPRRIIVIGGPTTPVEPQADLVAPEMLASPDEVTIVSDLMRATGLERPSLERAQRLLRFLGA